MPSPIRVRERRSCLPVMPSTVFWTRRATSTGISSTPWRGRRGCWNPRATAGDASRFTARDRLTWLRSSAGQSRLVWSAPVSGRYGIRVSVHWTLRYPPSEYRFTLSVLDPDDHGNDAARSSTLVPGRPQSGLIDYVGDVDVFRLPVAAEEVWVLDTTHSDYGTDFRADFVPVNGDADPANSRRVDDDGAYLASPANGTWLVSVGGENAFGDYTLMATRWDVPDDYGDSRRDAHPIPAPERPDSECENDPRRRRLSPRQDGGGKCRISGR